MVLNIINNSFFVLVFLFLFKYVPITFDNTIINIIFINSLGCIEPKPVILNQHLLPLISFPKNNKSNNNSKLKKYKYQLILNIVSFFILVIINNKKNPIMYHIVCFNAKLPNSGEVYIDAHFIDIMLMIAKIIKHINIILFSNFIFIISPYIYYAIIIDFY